MFETWCAVIRSRKRARELEQELEKIWTSVKFTWLRMTRSLPTCLDLVELAWCGPFRDELPEIDILILLRPQKYRTESLVCAVRVVFPGAH